MKKLIYIKLNKNFVLRLVDENNVISRMKGGIEDIMNLKSGTYEGKDYHGFEIGGTKNGSE